MKWFEYESFQQLFFGNIYVRLASCFALAFFITFVLVPTIVEIAKAKSLTAEPNNRTSHNSSIPTLGGLAIFTGLSISLLIFFDFTYFPKFQYTIAGLLIIFFTGFKDDIIGITPMKKLFAQVIAAMVVITFGRIIFTDLHGFLGVFEVNYHIGILITLVSIIGITNCFNLMDGIDGLTASLGLLASLTFGTWFYLIKEYNWAMLSGGLAGALLAFFLFNVFGKKNKIFMGDTGSLVLGFIIAIMAITFNELNISLQSPYYFRAAPAASIGIIMIPVFDTLRVFITRILKNKHPFSPDKTHIHHYLLQLGFSHLQSTLILFFISIGFIAMSWYLRSLTVAWLLLVLFASAAILSSIPILIVENRVTRHPSRVTNLSKP
jgi:UDP-N-acetylmuramyl pentapeptide phosphotransferase/UDP-N-acetylglucosamine-1-phosphate transferase